MSDTVLKIYRHHVSKWAQSVGVVLVLSPSPGEEAIPFRVFKVGTELIHLKPITWKEYIALGDNVPGDGASFTLCNDNRKDRVQVEVCLTEYDLSLIRDGLLSVSDKMLKAADNERVLDGALSPQCLFHHQKRPMMSDTDNTAQLLVKALSIAKSQLTLMGRLNERIYKLERVVFDVMGEPLLSRYPRNKACRGCEHVHEDCYSTS